MNNTHIRNILISIFKDLEIYDKIIGFNPIIAGGSIADLLRLSVDSFNEMDLTKSISGDIDVYVPYLDSDLIDPFNYLEEIESCELVNKTNLQMKLKPRDSRFPEINFVRTRNILGDYISGRKNNYKDLVDLLSRFDLECIKCGIIIDNEDTSMLHISSTSPEYIFNKIAKISLNGLELNSLYGILARLHKYKLKGFKIDTANVALCKAKAAINDINLDDICVFAKRATQETQRDFKELYDANSDTVNNFRAYCVDMTYREIIEDICYYGGN